MKKILVISATFFPQNRISVLRIGQWVKYLAKYDYEITVLTTKKYPFLGPFDLNEQLPENVQIVEVDFLPKFLVKKLSSSNVTTSSNEIDKINHIKLFIRKLRKYIGSLFDMYDLWIRPATKKAIELHKAEKYDYIISSFSPPAVHIVAHRLKNKFPEIQWVADFRDLWAYNHLIAAKGILGILEKNKEKRVIANADAIITVSEYLSDVMKNVYPQKSIYTIENGFDPEEYAEWKERIVAYPPIGDKIVISYLGTIYPGKRDPSILFDVVNELIKENIIQQEQIEINFYGNNKKEINEIIKKKNYNKYGTIHINGFVDRKKSLNIQRESDLLLFLEWNDPSANGVLTGKLFEYLVSATPIVAVGVTDKNAAGEIIKTTQVGELYIHKEKLKKDLSRIMHSKKVFFYNTDIKEIEKFSREKQVKKLVKIMDSLEN